MQLVLQNLRNLSSVPSPLTSKLCMTSWSKVLCWGSRCTKRLATRSLNRGFPPAPTTSAPGHSPLSPDPSPPRVPVLTLAAVCAVAQLTLLGALTAAQVTS